MKQKPKAISVGRLPKGFAKWVLGGIAAGTITIGSPLTMQVLRQYENKVWSEEHALTPEKRDVDTMIRVLERSNPKAEVIVEVPEAGMLSFMSVQTYLRLVKEYRKGLDKIPDSRKVKLQQARNQNLGISGGISALLGGGLGGLARLFRDRKRRKQLPPASDPPSPGHSRR